MSVAGLLLAAGRSSRMEGRDKLMEPVRGIPLIAERAACLAKTTPAIVVLRADRPARRQALAHIPGLTLIDAPDPDAGMGASIAAGVAALPERATAVLILPADMPGIAPQDIKAMLDAYAQAPSAILRGATPDGQPGHPVLFPRCYFDALAQLSGDIGARDILKSHASEVRQVIIPADGALLDLDTPQAWAAWRARQS